MSENERLYCPLGRHPCIGEHCMFWRSSDGKCMFLVAIESLEALTRILS